jgi:drug/metabolite transporter (DMT)-like permease
MTTFIAVGTGYLLGEQTPAIQLAGGLLTILGVVLSSLKIKQPELEK